jgi:amino acid transporter
MATETAGTGVTVPTDVGLKREIGLIGATWASETSIIGSGWLFGAFGAATAAGTSALLGWVVGGIIVIILALVHAELGGMYPVSGGTARFPHFAFGGAAGVSFGFFSWLQAVTVAPIECFAVMEYGSYAWHGLFDSTNSKVTTLGFVMTIILMAIFTALNFLAIKLFNKVNSGITWWKVAIPVLAIIILAFKFKSNNLNVGGFMPFGAKAFFSAIPSAGIVFAYLGFEQADQLAGEVKNPQRNLPLAIVMAVVLGTIIYVMLQVVIIGAMPPGLISSGFAGIAKTNPIAIAPFAGLSAAVGLTWLATIVRIDGFISPSGTGLVYVTSTSRVGYGLARNRYYPSIFGKVDKNGVPWFSLIIAFVFGLFFTFPFPTWVSLVNLITSASVLMYAGAPLALGAFRRVLPDVPRPYRMPGAVVISPLAFIVANLIVYWSGFETVWKLGVALLLGYLLILMHLADNPNAPKIDWLRSAWIGAYLLGMGIISWQGKYGPDNTNRIPFWVDMGIVAAFSLAIYIWAVYFGTLTRAEMDELMSEQSATTVTGGGDAAAAA